MSFILWAYMAMMTYFIIIDKDVDTNIALKTIIMILTAGFIHLGEVIKKQGGKK